MGALRCLGDQRSTLIHPLSSVSESSTLQFESARVLQALYANDHKLLKALEEQIEVKLTTRDGWLRDRGRAGCGSSRRGAFSSNSNARGKTG